VVLPASPYVPGVTVSGTDVAGRTTLRIGGSAAAHGTLRIAAGGALSGALAGKNVHLASFPASVAEAGASTLVLSGNPGDALRFARHLAALRSRGE
jgi:hypothetical protein